MADVSLLMGMGIVGDLPQIQGEMQKIGSILKQNPVEIQIQAAGIDLSSSSNEAKAFFDMVSSGASNVDKLTVVTQEFRDKAGNVFSVPVSALQKLKGESGYTKDSFMKLNETLIETKKATDGWSRTGNTEKAVLDIGGAARELEKALGNVKKGFDSTESSVDKFMAKSANMSGKQVNDARAVGMAYKTEKAEFDRLFATHQWDAAGAKAETVRRLAVEFGNLKSATAAGANVFQSWAERMGNAIKQTISYGLSIQLVQKAQRLLNEAIRYTIDLNTEMVKIQVLQAEGAQTPEQINALAVSFNNLGQEMAASTLEIAKGSVEWFRQGRTVRETAELMRSSLELSKLGAMSSADATNYLTSITNAFKVEVQDTSSVVDKLIAVDNIAATSAGELATAMRYTSESAAIAGVTMDQLVSYIGTVSTVTRQNAEMIGQAFKTMFARMTLIEGGGVDEDNMTISKVEKVLQKVNITLKNSQGNFRGMGDVLEEIAGRWDTLAERERMEIAIAIGGVRQKEPFLVLMDNMNKALEYQRAETDATGLAQERYGIYLESVEAKQAKLTAAIQELYTTTVNSDMVSWFIDAGINITKFVNSLGGIPPILGQIIALLIIFNRNSIIKTLQGTYANISNLIQGFKGLLSVIKYSNIATDELIYQHHLATMAADEQAAAEIQLAIASRGAAGAMGTLNAALGAIGIIAIAAFAIYEGIQKHLEKIKQAAEEAKKANEDFIESLKNLPGQQKSAEDLLLKIQELRNKPTKTTEEEKELTAAYNELYKLLPNLTYSFTEMGDAILDSSVSMDDLRKAAVDFYLTSKSEGTDLPTYFKEYADSILSARINIKNAVGEQKLINEVMSQGNATVQKTAQAYIDAIDAKREWVNTGKGGRYVYTSTEFEKNLSQSLRTALEEGANSEEIAAILNKGLLDASAVVSGNNSTINSEANDFKKMYSMVYDRIEPEYIKIRKEMEEVAGSDPGLLEAIRQVGYEHAKEYATQWESSKWQIPIPDTEAAFSGLVDEIKEISSLQDKWNDITKDSESTSLDYQQVIQGWIDKVNDLNEAGANLPVKTMADFVDEAGNIDTYGFDMYIDALYDAIENSETLADLTPGLKNLILDMLDAVRNKANENINTMIRANGVLYSMSSQQFSQFAKMISQRMWEQAQASGVTLTTLNGQVIQSAQNIEEALIQNSLNYNAFIASLTSVTNGYLAETLNLFGQAAGFVTGGGLTPVIPTIPTGGGGGGGGNPHQDEIDALDELIKAQEKEKEAIQEKIKAYKEYIDAQKESLKRAKEEADFQDELAKKHKDVAKIKARLAILALDDSEEAQAERAKLEEELADKEEDITKTNEDRKYDLQIQALDDMQKAFEDAMKAQIDRIDDVIATLKEQQDALRDTGSGGGGSYSSLSYQAQKYRDVAQEVLAKVKEDLGDQIDQLDVSDQSILNIIQGWLDLGATEDEAYNKAVKYLDQLKEIAKQPPIDWGGGGGGGGGVGGGNKVMHGGGIVESHHSGNFAGNLMANEVFAKLLKGEYIATEGQMRDFLSTTLPKIAIGMHPSIKNNYSTTSQKTGDIKLDLDINVAGNLDKTALPDIEKSVLKAVNKALETRGIRRTANNFSV